MTGTEIDAWIKRAQFTVVPRYGPKDSKELLVVTVEGLRKFLGRVFAAQHQAEEVARVAKERK